VQLQQQPSRLLAPSSFALPASSTSAAGVRAFARTPALRMTAAAEAADVHVAELEAKVKAQGDKVLRQT
jgi:hypothetical protein